MAWVDPTSRATGYLIPASEWDQNVVTNPLVLRAGGISIASQATLDFIFASSATQFGRLAKGSANQSVRLNAAGTAYEFFTPGGGLSDFRGQLRTSPDADKAAAQLYGDFLQVVMDDGTKFMTSISDLNWNMATSGLGGIDTGTEQASTWYEAYVIAKEDGTVGTLIHRAKDYFLDEQQTTVDSSIELREGATTNVKVGQTFDTDVTGYVDFVDIGLDRQNVPSGQIWAELYATSAGLPTGAALATGDKLSSGLFQTGQEFFARFVFRTPVFLTAGTTYAVVMNANYSSSGTINNRIQKNSAGGYAAGSVVTFDGTTWTATAGEDLSFKVYVTENNTAVTYPSGYTKKCLVGYVYNDSGSNFDPFVAQDRFVHRLAYDNLGSVTATIPTLMNLSAMIPPIPCTLDLIARNSTAGNRTVFGGVPDGYEPDGNEPGRGGALLLVSAANNAFAFGGGLVTEFQSFYVAVNANTSDIIQITSYRW